MRTILVCGTCVLLGGLTAATATQTVVATQNPRAAGVSRQAQTPAPAADEHPKFPPGEGRDLAIKVCSTCHEAELASDSQLDPAGWKSLVDDMASKGADATEAQLEEIIGYLAKAFPPAK